MEAEAGMAYRDIAASAYRAYAANTGNKNFRGDPMPQWDHLPRPIQVAWEAAIRQAERCSRASYDMPLPPDESTWAGWTPPA
jgi:hypothetical protein